MKKWSTALIAVSFLLLCLGFVIRENPWRLVLCIAAVAIPLVLLLLSFNKRK